LPLPIQNEKPFHFRSLPVHISLSPSITIAHGLKLEPLLAKQIIMENSLQIIAGFAVMLFVLLAPLAKTSRKSAAHK
jgi:hypothetical protein